MDIKEQLKKNRPNLSETSLKTYSGMINAFLKRMGEEYTEEYFDENVKKVLEEASKMPLNTRKTLLSGLVVLCNKKKCVDYYRQNMIHDAQKYEKEEREQKMTEKQEKVWKEQSEIIKRVDALSREVKHLWTKEEPTMMDLQKLQYYVIGCLYTMQEPRRLLDYTEMKWKSGTDTKSNYIVGLFGKKPSHFEFNTYKTRGTYAQQKIEISKELRQILRKWVKMIESKTEFILFDKNFENISIQVLNQRLGNLFGEGISVNVLRHIRLTEEYKGMPSIKEMEERAEAYGHSVDQAMKYVKKKKE